MPKPVAHGAPQRLQGHRIYLRTLTENEATEEYASWLNDPIVNRYLETRHITIPELQQYIQDKNASLNAQLFGIFWAEHGTHIGNVKLEPIDYEKQESTMGILIGDRNYWGRGVATEATNLIVHYAFKELGMHEVNLGVIIDNKAAIHVYEKCGFVIDRVERGAVRHGSISYDKIVMRIRKNS